MVKVQKRPAVVVVEKVKQYRDRIQKLDLNVSDILILVLKPSSYTSLVMRSRWTIAFVFYNSLSNKDDDRV